jgi:hypothetical protein
VAGSRVVVLPRDANSIRAFDRVTGARGWSTTDEQTQRVLGRFENKLLFADRRRLFALDEATGNLQWERIFADAIQGEAVLAGRDLYVGSRAKLFRLVAGTGEVLEEQDWGSAGPLSGLALMGESLFGTARGTDIFPAIPADPILLSSNRVRVVHRLATPFMVDGLPGEWEALRSFPWEGVGGVRGQAVFAHDDRYLYVGLSAPAAGASSRLELGAMIGKKPVRWVVFMDADGRTFWEGLGSAVPAEARAVARHRLLDRTLTVEVVIPLSSLIGGGAARPSEGNRLGLELALYLGGQAGATHTSSLVRLGETLFLSPLTEEQESAAIRLAHAAPDLDVSWEVLEQAWRARTLSATDTADFYRDFLLQHARSPEAGWAMLRLDRLLRKALSSDPSTEILQLVEALPLVGASTVGLANSPTGPSPLSVAFALFDRKTMADHAGVPPEMRAWYQKIAGAYLSQWIYIDPQFKTNQIDLEFFDGQSWKYRVTMAETSPVAGSAKPPFIMVRSVFSSKSSDKEGNSLEIKRDANGNTWVKRTDAKGNIRERWTDRDGNVWESQNGQMVSNSVPQTPETGSSTSRTIPLPRHKAWEELRLPLLWLGLHDQPIRGLAFSQKGGSSIFYDRTAVVVDGKETILLDDDLAHGLAQGDWRWLTEPVKSGTKAHTTPHPYYGNQTVRYAVYFKEPIRHPLVEAGSAQPLGPNTQALLEAKLPLLPFGSQAVALLERLERHWYRDPGRRTALRQAILKQADTDDAPVWLDRFLRLEYEHGNDHPLQAIETLIRDCQLPADIVAEFRQRSAHSFVRTWQVLGPFPNAEAQGHSTSFAPESAGIDLDRDFDGLGGKVRWKLLENTRDRVELQRFLGYDQAGVVYAVCWVHSETKQAASLEIGSQDCIKVWINRSTRSQPVIDEPIFRKATPGQSSAKIELSAGWNELLVKLSHRAGAGAFFLELRDTDGSSPLPGLRTRIQPPKEEDK